MWTERIKEVIAILLVGDGVVALVNPFRHSLLWRSGPGLWERLMDPFVETPALTRWLGALEAAAGLWLASRQKAD